MSPRAGGEAAKLGERYERRWTVHELLRVLEGQAVSITLEEPGEAGVGIEFTLRRDDGVTEAHQVKRQHGDANNWTIHRLAESGVLAAAAAQIDLGREFHFVSILPFQRLKDMTERARGADDAGIFRESLNKAQTKDLKSLEALVKRDGAEAFALLRSLFVHWADEREIVAMTESRAEALIDGGSGRVAARALGDLAHDNLGLTLDSSRIRQKLRRDGLEVRATGIADAVHAVYESWESSIARELLAPEITRAEVEEIVAQLEAGPGTLLVAGPAGIGKSAVLLQVVRRLAERWPVLPLRLDLIEPFSSTHELGVERLGLGASPAASLAALAGGGDCLLVVDQLDIVSLASGRMPATFDAVANLLQEAADHPSMRVLVACRQFDLDSDDRLRRLVTDRNEGGEFRLAPLSDEEVRNAVLAIGLDPSLLTHEQRELLRSPFHLVLLQAVAGEGRTPDFTTSKELLDAFWDRKRRACRARRETRFAETIGALTDYMSANQRLAAPEAILDEGDLLDDADVLASEHVLVRGGGKISFFHEAFFDYAFARRWTARDESLVEFLRSDAQELSRRAEVRQVLTHLRESDLDRFVAEVEALVESPEVRTHIKDVVLGVLRTQPDPTTGRAWFPRLVDEGVLERWLASERREPRNHALELMALAADDEPKRLVEVLSAQAERPRFDDLVRRLVRAVRPSNVPAILQSQDETADEEVLAALKRTGELEERELEADRRRPEERPSGRPSPDEPKEVPPPIPADEVKDDYVIWRTLAGRLSAGVPDETADEESAVVRPVVERMLASESADVRRLGGELAALAAMELGLEDLLKGTLTADVAVREGAALGCAEWLPSARDGRAAASALRSFFADRHPTVRAFAAGAVVNLHEGSLDDNLELVKAFIASPAFEDSHALHEFLDRLERANGSSDELVLLAARRFLDLVGDRLDPLGHLGHLPIVNFGGAVVSEPLGGLVLRAYSRARDAESRGRALDLIDELLEAGAFRFSEFVGGAER